jgi:hypothetical protein
VLLARRDGAKGRQRRSRVTGRFFAPFGETHKGCARYLGSILVPTDEIALLLFEAASIAAATELAQQAAIPSERILEIVRLGAYPRLGDPQSKGMRR